MGMAVRAAPLAHLGAGCDDADGAVALSKDTLGLFTTPFGIASRRSDRTQARLHRRNCAASTRPRCGDTLEEAAATDVGYKTLLCC